MPLKAGKSLTTETTTRASKGKSSFKFSLFLKKMELNITRRIIDVNSNIIFAPICGEVSCKGYNTTFYNRIHRMRENLFLFFCQIFGQGFDQVLGEGKNHRYSVQYYRDGKIQCTVLLGRKNLLHRHFSKKNKLF